MMRLLLTNAFLLLLVSSCAFLQNKNMDRSPQNITYWGGKIVNESEGVFLVGIVHNKRNYMYISKDALRNLLLNRILILSGKGRGWALSNRTAVYSQSTEIHITESNLREKQFNIAFSVTRVIATNDEAIGGFECQVSVDIKRKHLFVSECSAERNDRLRGTYWIEDFDVSLEDIGVKVNSYSLDLLF